MAHLYRAFGLTIRSDEPVSSMTSIPDGADRIDVDIVRGHVAPPSQPQDVYGMLLAYAQGVLTIDIADSGRFAVSEKAIVVMPAVGASASQVDAFLLGSVIGALLHMRGIIPLHGNAVEVDGAAIVFCGDSGAGKSTLAAYFQDQGYRLLTDDLCAIRTPVAGPVVWPGLARLKLWAEAMTAFDRSTDGAKTVAWLDDKFELPIRDVSTEGPFPVRAIIHLRSAEDGYPAGLQRLRGLEAVSTVTANIYRRNLGTMVGAAPSYLAGAAMIASQTPIFAMNRRWGFDHFREEASRTLAFAATLRDAHAEGEFVSF